MAAPLRSPRSRGAVVIVYLAGLQRGHEAQRVIGSIGKRTNAGILFTFFDFQEQDREDLALARSLGWKVFLDSGAFSAAHQGKPVSLSAYATFISKNRKRFDRIASLDVIGDPEATAKNYTKLRPLGAIPVFHVGSDWKHLDGILEEKVPFALGGMVGLRKRHDELFRWQAKTWERIRAAGPRKVHGFGVNGIRPMASFPWDSCDSRSASLWARRGFISQVNARGMPALALLSEFSGKAPLASQLESGQAFRGAKPRRLLPDRASRSALISRHAIMILDFAARLDEYRAAKPKGASR